METRERAAEAARSYSGGMNCAQSVMSAYAAELGLDPAAALAIIEGLGGGVGGRQRECGAVLAAACAVSGAVNALPGAGRADVYEAVQAMCAAFAAELGSTDCAELFGGGKPYRLCCPDKVECAVRAAEAAIEHARSRLAPL
jgi:C_GCAxxG_C_C family probable redox protein